MASNVHFSSDFITTCSLPGFSVLIAKEEFVCSDGIFPLQMYHLFILWYESDCVQNVFEMLFHLSRMSSSLLSKTPFWTLMDIAV